jgi:hypothetical protein
MVATATVVTTLLSPEDHNMNMFFFECMTGHGMIYIYIGTLFVFPHSYSDIVIHKFVILHPFSRK